MYAATSRDLAHRADLTDSRLVIDLCGGAGATAEAILELAPADAQVISIDNAAAMQRVGRRTLTDPRLTWITAPAQDLADHVAAQLTPWCATPRSGRPRSRRCSPPCTRFFDRVAGSCSTSGAGSPGSTIPTRPTHVSARH